MHASTSTPVEAKPAKLWSKLRTHVCGTVRPHGSPPPPSALHGAGHPICWTPCKHSSAAFAEAQRLTPHHTQHACYMQGCMPGMSVVSIRCHSYRHAPQSPAGAGCGCPLCSTRHAVAAKERGREGESKGKRGRDRGSWWRWRWRSSSWYPCHRCSDGAQELAACMREAVYVWLEPCNTLTQGLRIRTACC